jgi:xanthine dehydrogenase accessory factor
MLAGDHRPRSLRFGYTDADAIGVGLTCGGTIELLLRHHDPATEPELEPALVDAVEGETVAVATIVRGPSGHLGRTIVVRPGRPVAGTLGDSLLDRVAGARAADLLHAGRTGTVEIGVADSYCHEPLTLLVESSAPPPRMLVFGAIDHAAALARLGTFLGYRVTVCDARTTFATPERFPDAEVVVDWPHRYLASQAEAGLLDRRTVVERMARLHGAGLSDRELERLCSPIGLDLGARTPQETALSIAAEIVAHRHGGSGVPLSTGVPIHHSVPSSGVLAHSS